MTNFTQETSAPIAAPSADEPAAPPPFTELLGSPPPHGRIVIETVFDIDQPMTQEIQAQFLQCWTACMEALEGFGVSHVYERFEGLPFDFSLPSCRCSHCGSVVSDNEHGSAN